MHWLVAVLICTSVAPRLSVQRNLVAIQSFHTAFLHVQFNRVAVSHLGPPTAAWREQCKMAVPLMRDDRCYSQTT
jgi:hypothetical protein